MAETGQYPWYNEVSAESSIQQGDFVMNCPIIAPQDVELKEDELISGEVTQYDVIIMSQSCDIASEKINQVLVCPFQTLSDVAKENTYYNGDKGKESLKRGFVVSLHMLNRCDFAQLPNDYLVVDFGNTFSLNLDFLKKFVVSTGDRIRLLPPYREHLSQAFARFVMRVGLPIDIESFQKKT